MALMLVQFNRGEAYGRGILYFPTFSSFVLKGYQSCLLMLQIVGAFMGVRQQMNSLKQLRAY